MEYIILNNQIEMPILGLGVFQVPDKKECQETVFQAIKAGYRLIDTAASYMNEDAVGNAVKQAIEAGICTREELFITSKLWVQDMRTYETAKQGIENSLKKSGLEYFDLYLLHQAMGDYFAAWRAMEDAYHKGKLRAIGVSNFYPNILTNFCEIVEIKPMVNQIELHPYFTQEQAIEMGQVLLRWNIQRDVVVIPKSTHIERIIENINVFDFELNNDEMKKISSLDMGYSGSRAKHFEPDFVRMVVHRKIHE